MGRIMSSATEALAGFIHGFDGAALSDEAIYNSKMAVLDTVGVTLAGFKEPVGRVLRASVPDSVQEATIWGTGHKVSAPDAALVNGATAHALDYDDMNRLMLGHPSAVLVPAAFAAGEKLKCTGRKLLEGYIVGLEVVAKLGLVLNPGLYEKGWHPTSVLGTMGACACACYLFGLRPEQTVNAIGLAASEASGIKKNFGSMTKPFHAGSAARKGVWVAILAANGMTADPQSLDGTFGFLDLFKGDIPYDVEPLSRLGSPLEITASGLAVKPYPCCGSIHSVVDCLLDIRQKEDIRPEQVKIIECIIHPQRIPHINRPKVQSGLQGKFSLQYVAAAALLDGGVGFGQFEVKNIERSNIRSLMKKVHIIPDQNLGDFASRVTIRTSDGREFSRTMPEAKGSPALPLTEDEVFQKFLDCAMTTMNYSRAEKAGKEIMALEKANNLDPIVKLFVVL